jgi:hypothetical protein
VTAPAAEPARAPRERASIARAPHERASIASRRARCNKVLPGLKAALLDTPEWEADVFVETWTTLGVSRHERIARGPELAKTGAPLDPQWSALYGPRLRHVRFEDTPMNASRFFHGVEMPRALVSSAREHYSSTLPNLRKTYQCVQAVRAWESNSRFRYDAVVKLRPDGACADPRWSPLARAIRRVVEHSRNASAQPQPFFHGNPWPSIMVSDQTAVGTSDAMAVFADAWLRLPALFSIPCLPQAAPGCNYQMTDEKLMKVHMMVRAARRAGAAEASALGAALASSAAFAVLSPLVARRAVLRAFRPHAALLLPADRARRLRQVRAPVLAPAHARRRGLGARQAPRAARRA